MQVIQTNSFEAPNIHYRYIIGIMAKTRILVHPFARSSLAALFSSHIVYTRGCIYSLAAFSVSSLPLRLNTYNTFRLRHTAVGFFLFIGSPRTFYFALYLICIYRNISYGTVKCSCTLASIING